VIRLKITKNENWEILKQKVKLNLDGIIYDPDFYSLFEKNFIELFVFTDEEIKRKIPLNNKMVFSKILEEIYPEITNVSELVESISKKYPNLFTNNGEVIFEEEKINGSKKDEEEIEVIVLEEEIKKPSPSLARTQKQDDKEFVRSVNKAIDEIIHPNITGEIKTPLENLALEKKDEAEIKEETLIQSTGEKIIPKLDTSLEDDLALMERIEPGPTEEEWLRIAEKVLSFPKANRFFTTLLLHEENKKSPKMENTRRVVRELLAIKKNITLPQGRKLLKKIEEVLGESVQLIKQLNGKTPK